MIKGNAKRSCWIIEMSTRFYEGSLGTKTCCRRFWMRHLSAFVMFASLAWFAPAMHAESHNPADYPLRIHIFRRNETTFYHNRQAEETKGEGRANLFEGGAPKGIDRKSVV